MFYPQSAHIIARAGRGWIYCGSPTATSTWSSKKKVNGVGRPIATGDTGTRAVYVLGLPPCAHTPRFFLRYAIAAVGRRYAPLRGLCARAAALRAYAALFFLRYAIAAVGRRYAPLRGLCARAAALRAYARANNSPAKRRRHIDDV